MDNKPIHKTFEIQVAERRKDGGRIIINTAGLDRDRDRVMPSGARTESFLSNPVVQWGHNYRDPWSTIGKANQLLMTAESIIADFTLRPAANDQDPQNIVRLLWEGEWVRTASIGFIPKAGQPNAEGGMDFTEWELLEFSLVPIPANQDALRLAVKGIGAENFLSRSELLDALGATPPVKSFWYDVLEKENDASRQGENLAWIRRLTVESNLGVQTVFACFRQYTINVPKDAEKMMSDKENGIYSAPHPHAGKTLLQKEVTFVPPIEYEVADWGKDATFQRSSAGASDDEMVKAYGDEWDIKDFSDVLLALPLTKSLKGRAPLTMDVCELKLHDVARVKAIVSKRAAQKRGRVLSAKNEATLRGAQADLNSAKDKLDGVLAQLDEAPNADDSKDDQKEVGRAIPAPDAPEHITPPMPPSLPAEVATGLSVELRQLVNVVKTVFA